MADAVNVPVLGPQIPRQGGAWSAALGRGLLRLVGWRFEGGPPDVPRAVLIVAPHTSNWDFPLGLSAKLAMRLRVHWLGKHTIFRYGLGLVWRPLGGIAVDRRAATGVVGDVLREFQRRRQLIVAIAPEGTRRKAAQWKSGFHRMARAAGVPIVPVAFDYRRRAIVFFPAFEPGEDYAADLARLQALYSPEMAYRPDQY